jgi:hypothetical protein
VVAFGVTVHEKEAVVLVVEESGPDVNVTTGAACRGDGLAAVVTVFAVLELWIEVACGVAWSA